MRIFITGGAGYVGSHCSRQLRQSGHTLRIYDNLGAGHRAAVAEGELVVGDLADLAALRAAMAGWAPDAGMHFAASIAVGESVEKPLLYYRNNVANTIGLLDVMAELDVRRLVFSSTCAIYGEPETTPMTEDLPADPKSPYARTKYMMEQVFADCSAAWGLGFAALRYFNASGAASDGSIGEDHDPETHLIPIVLQVALGRRKQVQIYGTDYPTPDGTCIRDYIHVEDLGRAHEKALLALAPGRSIIANLGTGRGHSVREVIETAKKVTGCDIPMVETGRRAGDCPVLYADPSHVRKVLGWQAQITELEAIVGSAWRWHQAHPDGYSV